MTERTNDSTKLGTALVVLLCGTLVYTTLIYGGVDTGVITLLAISTTFLLCLWAGHAWQTGEFCFYRSWIFVPILGWFAIGLIQLLPVRDVAALSEILGTSTSASLSFDQYATRFFVIRLVFYLVFMAASLTFINSERRLRGVAWTIITFGSLVAFFGILQWLAKPDAIYGLRPTPQAIPFGPFVNQHHFAALMEMTGGLTLGILLGNSTKKDKRPLLLIALVLMTVAIVLTGSRGGLGSFLGVAIFVGVSTIILRTDKKSREERTPLTFIRRFLPIAVIVAVLLIAIGMTAFLGGERSLLRGAGIENAQSDLTSGRAQFWQVALQIIATHPLLGTGFDTFAVAFTKFDPSNGTFRVEQAHNDYLQTLADGGIAAFGCLAAFLYIFFRSSMASIRGQKDNRLRGVKIGALAGCFGIMIHSFFDFPMRTPANAFFFLMLAALAIVNIVKRDKKAASGPDEQLSER